MVFLVGVGYVIATNPAVHGHSTITGNLDITGDLKFVGSTNQWIFHTPDDGRTSLFIAHDPGGGYDWSKQTEFRSDGRVVINDLEVGTCTGCDGTTTLGQNGCSWTSWCNDCSLTCPLGKYVAGVGVSGTGCGGDCVNSRLYCCTP